VVDFTNILRAAILLIDPKIAKKDSQVISHFGLLGSTHVEATCKHVGEIDPRNRESERGGAMVCKRDNRRKDILASYVNTPNN